MKLEQNRFGDEVKKIAASGVDSIYYAGYEVECPYLRADLRDAGLSKLTFMASDGCFLGATIDNSDGAAEGMYVTSFAPSPKSAVDRTGSRPIRRSITATRTPTRSTATVPCRCWLTGEKGRHVDADKVEAAIRQLDVKTALGQIQYLDDGDLRARRSTSSR